MLCVSHFERKTSRRTVTRFTTDVRPTQPLISNWQKMNEKKTMGKFKIK